MKLRHDRERIPNAASTHNGDLIAKAPKYMVAENAKQLSGVYYTGQPELAQDDEARNHATAAIIQDRCELSGVNDTIETVQPRNCVEQRKPKTQNQGQPGRR